MFNLDTIAVIDLGKNQGTFVFQDENIELTNSDLFDKALTLPPNTLLVCEDAHLGVPRKLMSKAQYFTSQELLDFYNKIESKNIILRFFPQGLTPRALNFYRKHHNLTSAEFPKSDQNDPIAIRYFLSCNPHLINSLKKPKQSFEEDPLIEQGHSMVKAINRHLNYARGSDKSYGEEDDECLRFLLENIDAFYHTVSDNTKEFFGFNEKGAIFKIKAKAGKVNPKQIKLGQLYSILACMLQYNGELRVRPNTQQIAGVKFWLKRIFRMHPFHARGGVLRSNINHHTMKNVVKKTLIANDLQLYDLEGNPSNHRGFMNEEQEKLFLEVRKKGKLAIVEAYQTWKSFLEKGVPKQYNKEESVECQLDFKFN